MHSPLSIQISPPRPCSSSVIKAEQRVLLASEGEGRDSLEYKVTVCLFSFSLAAPLSVTMADNAGNSLCPPPLLLVMGRRVSSDQSN